MKNILWFHSLNPLKTVRDTLFSMHKWLWVFSSCGSSGGVVVVVVQ